jgi:hypothetical protein
MSAERFAALRYDATDHVFRDDTAAVPAIDAALAEQITPDLLTEVIALVPDEWLEAEELPDAVRERYVAQLLARLDARDAWLPGLGTAATAGGAGRRRAPRGENRPAWLGPPPPEGVTQR